jgi:hypothetical protein
MKISNSANSHLGPKKSTMEYSPEEIAGGKAVPRRLRYERLKTIVQRELSAKVVLPGTPIHRART